MKTIQLTFLFEDTGFCKDVFQSVNQPYYYCNRDTVDGTWYTSTPDDYQNDCRIRKDVIIEVISDGQVIALDGNGDFEGKKPFIPFCTFRERLAQEFLDKHPGLHGYEDMKQKLLFLPGGEPYSTPSHCPDNWIFALDFGNETEQVLESADWMGPGVPHPRCPVHAQAHRLCIHKLSFSGGSPPAECFQPRPFAL